MLDFIFISPGGRTRALAPTFYVYIRCSGKWKTRQCSAARPLVRVVERQRNRSRIQPRILRALHLHPLFTYANEYGSMPLIRIPDPVPRSFQGCLSVCLDCLTVPRRVWFFILPRFDLPSIALDFSLCSLLSQFSGRGYLIRLR